MKRGKRKKVPKLDTVNRLAMDQIRNVALYSIRKLGLFFFFDPSFNLPQAL
jgi:hypothetical protein